MESQRFDSGFVVVRGDDSAYSVFLFVIASASEAINEHRIPRKSARKAMAKPQHSAALDSAIFDSPLLTNAIFPTTAHTSMFSY